VKLLNKSPWMSVAQDDDEKKTAEIVIDAPIGYYDWDADTWQEAKRLTKQAMRKELKALAELKTERIRVEISSPGGYTDHGLAIHDLLKEHPAEIITRVYGQTASAATIVAQAADKGMRLISENALYLIHKASLILWGMFNPNDLRAMLADTEKITERMIALYAKRGGHDLAGIAELMDADNGNGKWLSPEEARGFGLVDDVYEPTPSVSLWTPDQMAFCALPPLPDGYAPQPQNQGKKPGTGQTPDTIETDTETDTDGDNAPTQEPGPMALDKQQMTSLRERFGAEFALSQFDSDAEYVAALEAGADMLAGAMQETEGELEQARTKITELEAKANGLADPLENDEQRETPSDAEGEDGAGEGGESAAEPKTAQQIVDELTAGGMTPSHAWAKVVKEHPDEYKAFLAEQKKTD